MSDKLILINLETLLENDIKSPKLNSSEFSDKIKDKLELLATEGYYFGVFSKNNNKEEIITILNDNFLDDRMFDIIIDVPFSSPFEFAEEVIYQIKDSGFSISTTLIVNLFSYISVFQSLRFKEVVVNKFHSLKEVASCIFNTHNKIEAANDTN